MSNIDGYNAVLDSLKKNKECPPYDEWYITDFKVTDTDKTQLINHKDGGKVCCN